MFFATLLMLSLSVTANPIPMDEVVRTDDDTLISVTNAGKAHAPFHLVFVAPPLDGEGDHETFVFWEGPHFRPNPHLPDPMRVAGSITWGVVDSAVFSLVHLRPLAPAPREVTPLYLNPTQIDALTHPIDDILTGERAGWSGEILSQEFVDSISLFAQQHGCRIFPLIEYVKENAKELAQEWDLWFDVVYTSLEDVTAVAVRDGTMFVWDLHGTGHPMGEWTARESFPTPISGPFRIVRAGENLENTYFVDEAGAIYRGFGGEHRHIGRVRNLRSTDPNTLALLFEDQKTKKVGFLHAAPDGSMTVLDIAWSDQTYAADFLQQVESDQLRTNLDRIADKLREDRDE